MIRLLDKGVNESSITFTPRPSVLKKDRGTPSLRCDLITGYTCRSCGNVIYATFHTPKPVDIDKYEETNVYSTKEGVNDTIRKIVPNFEDPGVYKISTYETPTGIGQKISLKNHVINWKGVYEAGDRGGIFETGDRTCMYTSIISLRGEDLARHLALASGYNLSAYDRLNLPAPPEQFIIDWLTKEFDYVTQGIQVVKPVGIGPVAILVKREVAKFVFPQVAFNMFSKWDEYVEKQKAGLVPEGVNG